MMRSISVKYAARSLFRHSRRTIISVIGIGVGTGIALIAAAWMSGAEEMQVRAASESGAGHIRIVPDNWPETRDNVLRLVDWRESLNAAREMPGVKVATARARSSGLLAIGNRLAGLEVQGVQPETEIASNRLVSRSEINGRYLRPDDRGVVVIGRALARRLRVELGDELHATFAGRDEMSRALLRIVGIAFTGSSDMDMAFAHVTLEDLERLTGYEGAAEVSVLLDDHEGISSARDELASRITANEVVTWKIVNPEIAVNVEGDKGFFRIIVGIILLVVALGIMSAQLTAVLERRKEFGVLSALGMKDRQIVALVLTEAVFTGLGGGLAGLLFGGPFAWYLATTGVDMTVFVGEEGTFGNIIFDPIVYGSFGPWVIWYALGIALVATVAASLYPARFATKTDPASALKVV